MNKLTPTNFLPSLLPNFPATIGDFACEVAGRSAPLPRELTRKMRGLAEGKLPSSESRSLMAEIAWNEPALEYMATLLNDRSPSRRRSPVSV